MQIRNRLINFRVTEEEFLRLKSAKAVQQARCLSDFARTVVLQMASDPVSDCGAGAEDRVNAHDRRITALESKVAEIVAALVQAKTMPPRTPE